MDYNVDFFKQILSEKCIFIGNLNLSFTNFNAIFDSQIGDISWIRPNSKDSEFLVNNSSATCIFCNSDTFELFNGDIDSKVFIITNEPKIDYFRVLKHVKLSSVKTTYFGIHPTAIVHENCIIQDGVSIGAYSVVGACTIGTGVVIGEFVKIHDSVSIGDFSIIKEHVTIGGDGFGYYRESDDLLHHIPHIGNVKIGSNVHIFPFANVDCGTLSSTIIEDGSVIDHYVHISHNSKVGKDTIICASSVLAGGSEVKDNCFLGVNTLVKEKVVIGKGVTTGMGSVVVKDIPDNQIWVGNPAKFLRENIQ